MGTPEFAVPSLEILLAHGYKVCAVVTAPDKPSGRGLKVQQSAVKHCALAHRIPLLQPKNLKSPSFLAQLRSYAANLQVVVAFRMLPEAVWAMPTLGTFNLHASLLPQYRGAAPINRAIMNGETETGVSTFFLKHEIDTGDLILQEKTPIAYADTAGTLYRRLMEKGAKLVLKTVQQIEHNSVQTLPQHSEIPLKTAPKIYKKDCEIDFNRAAKEIYDFVRGLNPYPTAFTFLEGKRCKVFSVEIIENLPDVASDKSPGTLHLTENTACIKAKDGWISLCELQLEGRKRMPIKQFLRGFSPSASNQ